jgi:hypothetical protein
MRQRSKHFSGGGLTIVAIAHERHRDLIAGTAESESQPRAALGLQLDQLFE